MTITKKGCEIHAPLFINCSLLLIFYCFLYSSFLLFQIYPFTQTKTKPTSNLLPLSYTQHPYSKFPTSVQFSTNMKIKEVILVVSGGKNGGRSCYVEGESQRGGLGLVNNLLCKLRGTFENTVKRIYKRIKNSNGECCL